MTGSWDGVRAWDVTGAWEDERTWDGAGAWVGTGVCRGLGEYNGMRGSEGRSRELTKDMILVGYRSKGGE